MDLQTFDNDEHSAARLAPDDSRVEDSRIAEAGGDDARTKANFAYWRKLLAKGRQGLDLPPDRTRPAEYSDRVAVVTTVFSAESVSRVVRAGESRDTTPFMTLLAAFFVLLQRSTGQSDLLVGTPVAQNGRLGLEQPVASFFNTLPVRVQTEDDETFASVLAKVRAATTSMLSHADLPFDRLVREELGNREDKRHALFDVVFNFGDTPATVSTPGVDLAVALQSGSDQSLICHLTYSTDLFDRETIELLAEHFTVLLKSISDDPNAPIARLPLANATELDTIVNVWSRPDPVPAIPPPGGDAPMIHELVAFNAAHRPDATALIEDGGRPVTYAELDRRANRLAHALRARGVSRDVRVGLYLDRSVSAVIAMLATLKAGGAYVPLDPAYPTDRIDYMLTSAEVETIVTRRESFAVLGAYAPLLFDMDDPAHDRHAAEYPPSQSGHPEDLAYIMFTSGSTGKPKAVAIAHRGVVALVTQTPLLACTPHDTVLLHATLNFDASVIMVWTPLIYGARIAVMPAGPFSLTEFEAQLARYRVSALDLPTALFHQLVEERLDALRGLRRCIVAGDVLAPLHSMRFARAVPGCRLFNGYGPTEITVAASYHEVLPDTTVRRSVPIGRPCAEARVYILDELRLPVAVGVPGELWIGGSGVARGYLNDPKLTRERFVCDPFSIDPSARLYRSGDRARWLPSGDIEFLGRADTQVKIRGFRIEPAEIEFAMLEHPSVRHAAVVVRGSKAEQILIAYAAVRDGEVSEAALRSFLQTKLPMHAIPSRLILLDSLPKTSTDKLDRQALLDVDASMVRGVDDPPQGEAEEQIASIFAEALKIHPIGRHDNFFELGGHSLLAMTVIERMRAKGLQVEVRRFFTDPTVARLAVTATESAHSVLVPPNLIAHGATKITPDMLPLLNLTQHEIDCIAARVPGGIPNIQDIYPLAPLQQGILFHHLISKSGDTYLTLFLLAFDDRSGLDNFLSGLSEMMTRHDVLRTAVLWEQLREPVQVVTREAILPVEEVTLNETGHDDASQQLIERYDPRHYRIDIRLAPMLRAFIAHDKTNNRWLLSLLNHHLILDHVSLEVIFEEVRLISAGHLDVLPHPKPYRNFVAKTQFGIPHQDHEAFFRDMLGDVDEPTLPYGLSNVRGNGSGIRESGVVLEASLATRLRNRARALGVGPATLFHLAWAVVVAATSDRTDVVFGSVLFGRMDGGDGSERTLGLFINTLPMRVKIDAATVESGVLRTHLLIASMLRHEHASLALAQRCSGVPAPTPLFSAIINFRHSASADDAEATWPGAELLRELERTEYPIALSVDDRASDFLITAQVESPVDPARICCYMETALSNLLGALENAPHTKLQTITVLPKWEYETVTAAWNNTDAILKVGTLHALFEEQAALTPGAVAIICATESVTFAELNARADALANLLAVHDAGFQSVIGVALRRSVSTVVSFLAILKLGAIYLPLDPAYPRARLEYIIADSGAVLIVTNSDMESLISSAVICVNVDLPETASQRKPAVVTPDAIAYIIYTSGSTGKPKGVAVPHSAPVNLAFAKLAYDPIGTGDRILAAISVGFDVSIGQLLLPLLSGATIVILDELRSLGAKQFWEFLDAYGVTHINSVPSFFESILDAAPQSSSLVRLMLGGEPFSTAFAQRLRQALPTTAIINVYGPTEACIEATCYAVNGTEAEAFLPIGKPEPNYRAYILNTQLNPVGIGIEGDLYLAGAGLARGYVNQPELTAERFIVDPFGAPGRRMYKTGDRARWRADGNIEFVGRVDTQVKIRGHRIELGEIEVALTRQPGLREAAVIVREDRAGDKRLFAYYTADQPLSADVLRASVSSELPSYMVPAAYVQLRSMPLTTNGKLDRNALQASLAPAKIVPSPRPISEDAADPVIDATMDELQQQLVRLWEALLGAHPIGIRDDFFALGGHSLLAIRLFAEIERRFRIRLPLTLLFEQPTIEHIASALRSDPASINNAPVIALNANGTATPLFYLHGSLVGGGYHSLVVAEHLGADRPVFVMRPHGLDGSPLPPAIEAVASECIDILKSVQSEGPYLLGGYCSGGLVAFEMARQLLARGERVNNVLLIDVPHAGHLLRTVVELVDRLGHRVRVSAARRASFSSALCRLANRLGRLAYRLGRFRAAPDKLQYLRKANAKILGALNPSRIRARSEALAHPSYRELLDAWEWISDGYVTRRYGGRLSILMSEEEPQGKLYARVWSTAAPCVDIRWVPGNHYTCITDHIDATAKEVVAALV